MNLSKVKSLMQQQLDVLEELKELIAHDKKSEGAHGIKEEDVELFRQHVEGMEVVCKTAKGLADFYMDISKKAKDEDESAEAVEEKHEEEKPKRPSRKKKEAEKKDIVLEEKTPEDDLDFLN